MSPARRTIEKAAYAAVGAPVAAIKAMGARISDLRDAVASSRKDMGDDLTREMKEWIAEGERVIERAMKRVRSAEATEEITTSRRTAKVGVEKIGKAIDDALDVVAPDTDLTTINGIGPNYAEQLNDAGVSGVANFLSATGTAEDVSELARCTGFSAGTIESWRDQVDLSRVNGVGGAYLRLLHRVDVWTLGQLNQADPAQLTDALNSVDLPDTPEQMPSIYQVKQWVTAAGKLTKSS